MPKMVWETISLAEFADGVERIYRMEPHAWEHRKCFPWARCVRCGLLWFNNKLTRWAIGKGCFNKLHPNYRARVSGGSE